MKWWPQAAGVLLIFLLCGAFLPYPGLQNDELFFAQPLYRPDTAYYSTHHWGVRIPVMLLSYLGAWKSWFYAPILAHLGPSLAAIRWPVVAICALTLCIFSYLVNSLHGWGAAAIGSLLLATDSSFLLSGVFDWGPVAFQHLFFVTSLALAVHFYRTGRIRSLGWAAFFSGLGVWDKALFLWMLSGASLASLTLVPSAWKPTRRKLLAVGLGLAAGAFPLILYNAKSHLATFRSNGGFTLTDFSQKVEALKITCNGSVFFGFLINEDSAPNPRAPQTALERWSSSLHRAAGDHRTNWMVPALFAALLLLPVLWRTPARLPMLFALIAGGVAWIEMVVTPHAGGSAHHVVLLWPLPQLFLAVAIAEASRLAKRPGAWLAGAMTVVLVAANLLNVNQCFYQLARYGAVGDWTDASTTLAQRVAALPPGTPLLLGDWGIFATLLVSSRGSLNLRDATSPFTPSPQTEAQKRAALDLFSEKNAVWVRFAEGREQFSGINRQFDETAASLGFREIVFDRIRDRNQRPAFELLRVVR